MASAQVEAVMASLRKEAATAAKALILELDKELRRATPVDTGHARANWVPSVGEPFGDEAEGTSSAPHDTGISAVLSFRIGDGDLWISNNVPYIVMLNLGHSDQAPVGFVEAAIDRALATVQARYDGLQIEIKTTGGGTFSDRAGGSAAENLASAYSPFGDE